MALIWSKKTRSTHYEVRSAGNTIRLYTNKIFHSQWNPLRPLSGHLWDYLYLPMTRHKEFPNIKNILVLGVGGGAVINLINTFISPKKIVGVDLDKNHLSIARRFFHANAEFEHMCAEDYIAAHPTVKYDIIIDDLFAERTEPPYDAVRAIHPNKEWLDKLVKSLAPAGMIIMNCESISQFKDVKKSYRHRLIKNISCLQCHGYENAIAVISKQKLTLKNLTSD